MSKIWPRSAGDPRKTSLSVPKADGLRHSTKTQTGPFLPLLCFTSATGAVDKDLSPSNRVVKIVGGRAEPRLDLASPFCLEFRKGVWDVWDGLELAHSNGGDEEGGLGGVSRVDRFVSVPRGMVFDIGHQNGRSFRYSAAR